MILRSILVFLLVAYLNSAALAQGRGPAITRESAERLREGRAERMGPSSADRMENREQQRASAPQPPPPPPPAPKPQPYTDLQRNVDRSIAPFVPMPPMSSADMRRADNEAIERATRALKEEDSRVRKIEAVADALSATPQKQQEKILENLYNLYLDKGGACNNCEASRQADREYFTREVLRQSEWLRRENEIKEEIKKNRLFLMLKLPIERIDRVGGSRE